MGGGGGGGGSGRAAEERGEVHAAAAEGLLGDAAACRRAGGCRRVPACLVARSWGHLLAEPLTTSVAAAKKNGTEHLVEAIWLMTVAIFGGETLRKVKTKCFETVGRITVEPFLG